MSTPKLKKDVLKILAEQPLTLKELAAKMGLKEKKVFNLLKSLFEASEVTAKRVDDGQRKYRLLTAEEKAAALKAEEEREARAAAAVNEEEDDAEEEDEDDDE